MCKENFSTFRKHLKRSILNILLQWILYIQQKLSYIENFMIFLFNFQNRFYNEW